MSLVAAKVERRKTFETVNCDLCGSSDYSLKFTARNTEFREPFNLVECCDCGLVYLNPRPSKESIGRYYPEENYYAYQELDSQSWDNFRQKIKNFILECQPGYGKNLRFLRRIVWSFFQKSLMLQVSYREGGKILDVGCGNGYFLKWMQKQGWQVYGVEISKAASQVAQRHGLEVYNGELPKAKYPSDYFDVVTMNQVLEHVYSPSEYVQEAKRILKPNGILIICVPNIQSFEERIFQEHWYALDVPRHLYFFDIAKLKGLLERNNFEIRNVLSKSFGLSWVGVRQSIKNLLDTEYSTKSAFIRGLVRLKHYFIYALVRPLAYCAAPDKNSFGVYISIYAGKKK